MTSLVRGSCVRSAEPVSSAHASRVRALIELELINSSAQQIDTSKFGAQEN
jgi:hypothetical protein